MTPILAGQFVGLLLLAIGAVMNFRTGVIPNWLSAIGVIAFFVFAFLIQWHWQEILGRMGIVAVALLFGLVLFSLDRLGGGIAKIVAVSCLWFPVSQSVGFLMDCCH